MNNSLKCDFSFLDISELINRIGNAVNNKKAYSFVRLGDGEGTLLDYSLNSNLLDIQYLSEHFGPDCTLNELENIQSLLKSSINSADLIGLRDDIINVEFDHSNEVHNQSQFLEQFKLAFKLRGVDKSLPYIDARRIAKLHKTMGELNIEPDQSFCSQWIGFDYFLTGALPALLSEQKNIGLISARKGMDKQLEKAIGVPVSFYQIPDKHARQDGVAERHYPNAFNRIKDEIEVKYKGMPFIVAGGIVGKAYCQIIKEKGGVALDLGGLIDCWAGIYSRPKVIESFFEVKKPLFSHKKVPAKLLMNKSNITELKKNWLNSH
tara:strand:+ start:4711 stop:5673 length:963 start_codon:yes stop_codon:yes gene_type:complete